MKKLFLCVSILVGVSLLLAGTAGADTKTYQDSVPLAGTNWTSSITVPKFDPALGILNSIKFTLDGHVEGLAQFESEDGSPTTVTMNLSAKLKLQRPDGSLLVEVIPLVSTTDNVTAYDGTFDFDGGSGRTYSSLSNDKSDSFTSPPPASDLALFTGSGNITMPVVATVNSTVSGGGQLTAYFQTSASAQGTVVYDYTPIPEPSGMVAILAGLSSLAGLVVRHRRK